MKTVERLRHAARDELCFTRREGGSHQTSCRHVLEFVVGAITSRILSRPSAAQSYPDRPIRLVVSFPRGRIRFLGSTLGGQDQTAFGIGDRGNIGGAGASLGAATVAKARHDGYTILLGGTLPHYP